QSVTFTNQGSAALNLTSIALGGSNPADFAVVPAGGSPCPVSSGALTVGASCTVAVQFAPQSAGTKSASLTVSDNASGSPQTGSLAGTALAPPQVQIAPVGLSFGTQSAGTASSPRLVVVTNSGASSLSINSIGISGTNASDFPQTNNCPPVLGLGSA